MLELAALVLGAIGRRYSRMSRAEAARLCTSAFPYLLKKKTKQKMRIMKTIS